MKFSAVLGIVPLWLLLVYCPLAHMEWGVNGYMNGVWNPGASIAAIDFGVGTVVDMAPGFSALILCLGKAIDAISSAAKTGKIGDGKMFVLPLEEVVRIRTGERGESAV